MTFDLRSLLGSSLALDRGAPRRPAILNSSSLRYRAVALLAGVVLSCVTTVPASAADSAVSPEKNITVQWRAVAFEKDLTDLCVRSGGRELSVFVPAYSISNEYRYTGPNPVIFYRKTPSPDSEGLESSPSPSRPQTSSAPLPPAASVTIDPTWRNALIFMFPKADGTLITQAVRNDQDNFKPGWIRIYNLTNQQLLLRIDKKDLSIGAGQELQVKPADESGQISIRYGMRKGSDVFWMGSNFFSVTESGRTTVILTRTDSVYFRPVGSDGEVYPPKPIQVFSFSEAAAPKSDPAPVAR